MKFTTDYRTLEEVRKRETIVEANIEKSNKIKTEIEELKVDPSFLQEETEMSYRDILDKISNLECKKM